MRRLLVVFLGLPLFCQPSWAGKRVVAPTVRPPVVSLPQSALPQAPTTVVQHSIPARIFGAMVSLGRRIANGPEDERVPWAFKLEKGKYFYHGHTLDDLVRIVESGGVMAPEVSQFSRLPWDSVGYARTRQSNLKRPKRENPIVLLQFPRESIEGLVSGESFQAGAALMDRGVPPNHLSYAIATAPVPLSLMSEAAKKSILDWLAQRIGSDDRPWSRWLAQAQAAFSASESEAGAK